jgi:hypothetical protein
LTSHYSIRLLIKNLITDIDSAEQKLTIKVAYFQDETYFIEKENCVSEICWMGGEGRHAILNFKQEIHLA